MCRGTKAPRIGRGSPWAEAWRREHDMKRRRGLTATVAAIIVVIGTLGMVLWPSPAGAAYPIRKFTGAIDGGGIVVWVHNPHPTSTYKAEVVTRTLDGAELGKVPLTIPPNAAKPASPAWSPFKIGTLEVNMNVALLQPSVRFVDFENKYQYLHSGDFSR